ncbi:MAG: diphthine synthase [Candidatus Micrarchaeota archaeon]
MLTLIGLGIWNESDISVRGLEELKKAELVFAERYTHFGDEKTIENLEKMIGKKITILSREEVEGEKKILAEAEGKRVALLVGGDPMISTTHISLVLAAKKQKIESNVIHSSSIFTAAVGETGLQIYKFGKTVTLPFWQDNYKPTSTYDVILENKSRGLHTMVFLDIAEKMMGAKEALELLGKMEEEKKGEVARASDLVVVLSRIGSENQRVSFGKIGELLKRDLGGSPFILIFPGTLHFLEEEALSRFA